MITLCAGDMCLSEFLLGLCLKLLKMSPCHLVLNVIVFQGFWCQVQVFTSCHLCWQHCGSSKSDGGHCDIHNMSCVYPDVQENQALTGQHMGGYGPVVLHVQVLNLKSPQIHPLLITSKRSWDEFLGPEGSRMGSGEGFAVRNLQFVPFTWYS